MFLLKIRLKPIKDVGTLSRASIMEKIQINSDISRKFIESLSSKKISQTRWSVWKDLFFFFKKTKEKAVDKEALLPIVQVIRGNKEAIIAEHTPIFMGAVIGVMVGLLGKDLSGLILTGLDPKSLLVVATQITVQFGLMLGMSLIAQKKLMDFIEYSDLKEEDFLIAQEIVEKELTQVSNSVARLGQKKHALYLEWLLILKNHPDVSPFIRLGTAHQRKDSVKVHASVLWDLLDSQQRQDLIASIKFSENEVSGIIKTLIKKEDKLLFNLMIKIFSPTLVEKILQEDHALMDLLKNKDSRESLLLNKRKELITESKKHSRKKS